MKTLGPVLAASILGLTAGCAGHDDGREGKTPPTGPEVATAPPEPEPEPEPEPPASAAVEVAVASVQLQDDCPDEKAAADEPPAAEKSMMQPAEPAGDVEPGALGDMAYPPPCVQSRVQISIESEADRTLLFTIRAARLKNPDDDKALGEMTTRGPQVWGESKYEAWDQSIPAGASLKVGYALGAPDWSKIDKVLGDSWGPLYVVELEVEIDGEVRTILSPKIPRDEPENIVT